MILKKGDLCTVVAIGKDDHWFDRRHNIVGKIVLFSRYCDPVPTKTTKGEFIQCFVEPFIIPGSFNVGVCCFSQVRLKKIEK